MAAEGAREVIANRAEILYKGRTPKWRNWQTRGTQNPVRGDSGVGSIPTFGMTFFNV